jgi:uncharacterized membrane protein
MAAGQHIRNPFEMVVEDVGSLYRDLGRALSPRARAATDEAPIAVRRITPADLKDALRQGLGDLEATRADVLFIGVIYALAGLVLAQLAFNQDMTPLLFPLISGFALVGPLAAVGLYEISRRREAGEAVSWASAFAVLRSPAMLSILALGAILLALLLLWLLAASAIYSVTLGPEAPASLGAFLRDAFTTAQGWAMIVIGVGVGALFAALSFAISVVSFPLLLDRPVGVYRAIGASLRAVRENLGVMLLWGLIVAGALVAASIPVLLGLIVVMPLLGHATWRLYRKVVAPT